jgi:SAM-dependent methyltransferase
MCPSCGSAAAFRDSRSVWPPGWHCAHCGFEPTRRNGVIYLTAPFAKEPDGFDPKLFDILMQVEDSSFWFVNRAKLIVHLLKTYFPNVSSLLEIGCGTGSVLLALRYAFPRLTLAGSELLPEGLAFARPRLDSDVLLVQMDARSIPAAEEFDVIGAFDVLEHIADDEKVIAQIHGALKPGGGAIIAVPQHPWLWSPADTAACHQRRYSRGELEAKLQRAGFRILRSTSFNVLLLPMMAASRMLMRLRARLGAKLEPLSELQTPTWLNHILSTLLRLEVALTAVGVRWPVGSSRFVVAQRPQ